MLNQHLSLNVNIETRNVCLLRQSDHNDFSVFFVLGNSSLDDPFNLIMEIIFSIGRWPNV